MKISGYFCEIADYHIQKAKENLYIELEKTEARITEIESQLIQLLGTQELNKIKNPNAFVVHNPKPALSDSERIKRNWKALNYERAKKKLPQISFEDYCKAREITDR